MAYFEFDEQVRLDFRSLFCLFLCLSERDEITSQTKDSSIETNIKKRKKKRPDGNGKTLVVRSSDV